MYEKYYKRVSKLADIQLQETPQFQESAKQRVGMFTRQTDIMRSGYKNAIARAQEGVQVASADESDADMWTARNMAAIRQIMQGEAPPIEEEDVSNSIITPVSYAGGRDTEALAYAVRAVESTQNYQARGPVVKKGMYKGERALGAYQVMPSNLPSWSEEALGRVVSEKEFLETPAIQDAIFNHQMQKSIAKYGNVEDAVSIWFTGRPYEEAYGASDDNIDVTEYINRFQKHYNEYNRDKAVR